MRFGKHGGAEPGGHHGMGRGHGRGGRIFSHGGLRLVLLQLVADRPRHGYELIKDIEDRLQGLYSPSPGVIYPTLTLLEEQGFARVDAQEGNRKRYAATPEGLAHLQENRAAADELMSRMGDASRGPAERSPELMEAVHRLRHGMRMRLSRGPLNAQQTQRFIALVDRTLLELEQL